MIPVSPFVVVGREVVAILRTVCFDCFNPTTFRYCEADMPPAPKHLWRRCAACSAAAKKRKRDAAAEARRVRERELIERGRLQERRRVARLERRRRSRLQSVPAKLREMIAPAA